MNRLALALAIAVAATSAACATRAKRTEDFTTSVRAYNDAVRWHRYTHAAKHITDAERDAFLDERFALEKELAISGWEILRVDYEGDQRRAAEVHIRYEWHLDSEGVLHETHAVQAWELRGKRWVMASETRERGPEMPGLPEPRRAKKPVSAR